MPKGFEAIMNKILTGGTDTFTVNPNVSSFLVRARTPANAVQLSFTDSDAYLTLDTAIPAIVITREHLNYGDDPITVRVKGTTSNVVEVFKQKG